MLARLFILTLATCQLWACFFSIANYEGIKESYLAVPNEITMTAGYDKGGFPSFSIFTPTSGSYSDPTTLEGTYNDDTMFTYEFKLTSQNHA